MNRVKLSNRRSSEPIELASSLLEKLANWAQAELRESVPLGNIWNAAVIGMLRLAMRQIAARECEALPALVDFLKVDVSIGSSVDFNSTPELQLVDELIASLRVDLDDNERFANAHRLSSLYEMILNMVCTVAGERGSQRFRVNLVDKTKKRSGSFYTPPYLAKLVVERALSDIVQGKTAEQLFALKVVDPAMGAGVFIIEAFRFLENAVSAEVAGHKSWRSRLAYHSLYGVDLDPLAVEAARCALWLAVGDCSVEPGKHTSKLRTGNSLVGALISQASTFPIELFRKKDGAFCRSAKIFQNKLAEPVGIDLKGRLDRYCTLWYMSAQELELAMQPEFESELVEEIAARERFFHWELEYPEVYHDRDGGGFDAVVGNPPWEIEKPNSREFFGMVEPRYWALSKQEALAVQLELMEEDEHLFNAWEHRRRSHHAFMYWIRHAPIVSGKRFQFQGKGDVNLYKLFIEQSYHLVRRGGTVSLLTPSGIYSDSGTKSLRCLLLNENTWSELIGFENRDGTFAIHRSFKYCIIVFRKGGFTSYLKTTFANRASNLVDFEWCAYNRQGLSAISPKWMIIPEIDDRQVYSVVERIQSRTMKLGAFELGGTPLRYARELDMTLDSSLFRCRSELESSGFVQDIYGNWLAGKWSNSCDSASGVVRSAGLNRSIAVEDVIDVFCPLYEGRMIGQFDCNEKRWVEGKGRQALWRRVDTDGETSGSFSGIGPQYLVPINVVRDQCKFDGMKVGFLAVGSPTNARTMISTCLTQVACGNSVPVLSLVQDGEPDLLNSDEFHLALSACLNSFVFDFVLRNKMAGNNLNFFVIEESPLPVITASNVRVWRLIACLSSYLSLTHLRFCQQLIRLGFGSLPVVRGHDDFLRLLRAKLEVLIAVLYGVDQEELKIILTGTAKPSQKGFFRVDKELPKRQRLPAIVLSQFALLLEIGLDLYLEEAQGLFQNAQLAPVERVTLQEHANLFRFLLSLDRRRGQ